MSLSATTGLNAPEVCAPL